MRSYTVFQLTQRATENRCTCHAWHACRRLPTPGLMYTEAVFLGRSEARWLPCREEFLFVVFLFSFLADAFQTRLRLGFAGCRRFSLAVYNVPPLPSHAVTCCFFLSFMFRCYFFLGHGSTSCNLLLFWAVFYCLKMEHTRNNVGGYTGSILLRLCQGLTLPAH
jgi:hypothetical protein